MRIGAVIENDDPTEHPQNRRIWLSHRDLVQLVEKSLKTEVAGLKTEVASLKTQVAGLDSRMVRQEKLTESLGAEFLQLRGEVQQLRGDFKQMLADMQEGFRRLNAQDELTAGAVVMMASAAGVLATHRADVRCAPHRLN